MKDLKYIIKISDNSKRILFLEEKISDFRIIIEDIKIPIYQYLSRISFIILILIS